MLALNCKSNGSGDKSIAVIDPEKVFREASQHNRHLLSRRMNILSAACYRFFRQIVYMFEKKRMTALWRFLETTLHSHV
jgi:hypothetical protein